MTSNGQRPAQTRPTPPVVYDVTPRYDLDYGGNMSEERAVDLRESAVAAVAHIPLHVLRTLRWSPTGVGLAVSRLYRWVTDWKGQTEISLTRGEPGHNRVKRSHDRTVEARRWVVVILAVTVGLPVLAVLLAHRWLAVSVLGGLVWLAGWYGAAASNGSNGNTN